MRHPTPKACRCGGAVWMVVRPGRKFQVQCSDCAKRGPIQAGKREAIEAWNERSTT